MDHIIKNVLTQIVLLLCIKLHAKSTKSLTHVQIYSVYTDEIDKEKYFFSSFTTHFRYINILVRIYIK